MGPNRLYSAHEGAHIGPNKRSWAVEAPKHYKNVNIISIIIRVRKTSLSDCRREFIDRKNVGFLVGATVVEF